MRMRDPNAAPSIGDYVWFELIRIALSFDGGRVPDGAMTF